MEGELNKINSNYNPSAIRKHPSRKHTKLSIRDSSTKLLQQLPIIALKVGASNLHC